jgi:hypothetical protein
MGAEGGPCRCLRIEPGIILVNWHASFSSSSSKGLRYTDVSITQELLHPCTRGRKILIRPEAGRPTCNLIISRIVAYSTPPRSLEGG